MSKYSLTKSAAADIDAIAEYSIKTWGKTHAKAYITALKQAFQTLSDFPDIGQDASDIRSGYMRMSIASHVVFYRCFESDIQIVRALRQSRAFSRHLSE